MIETSSNTKSSTTYLHLGLGLGLGLGCYLRRIWYGSYVVNLCDLSLPKIGYSLAFS